MKAVGLVVSDKNIFYCSLKIYFLTLRPTYATNWHGLNNFGRGPPWDRRTANTMDNGPSQKLTLRTLSSGKLKSVVTIFYVLFLIIILHTCL